MVLDRKVGKARPFWRGFLLTLVTFGLYGIYWDYKAHDEVFTQFELGRRGRDDGVVFLVLGLLLAPLLLIYYYKVVENVNHVRRDLGLGEGVSSLEFLLWNTIGYLLLLLGPVIGYYKLQSSINEIWHAYEARQTRGPATEAAAPV